MATARRPTRDVSPAAQQMVSKLMAVFEERLEQRLATVKRTSVHVNISAGEARVAELHERLARQEQQHRAASREAEDAAKVQMHAGEARVAELEEQLARQEQQHRAASREAEEAAKLQIAELKERLERQ